MYDQSFKVFVRYELDGKEEEFFFFTTINLLETDHMVSIPLINKGMSMMVQRLAWDADKITSFKVRWTD